MQGTCYNQLATTLRTPVGHQKGTKPNITGIRAAFAAASYRVVAFLSDPAICKARDICCCVIHACCHRYKNAAAAAAAAAVQFSSAAEYGREFQPLLRRILFYFCCKYYPTTAVLLGVPCVTPECAVACVCGRCVPCVTRGVPPNFFILFPCMFCPPPKYRRSYKRGLRVRMYSSNLQIYHTATNKVSLFYSMPCLALLILLVYTCIYSAAVRYALCNSRTRLEFQIDNLLLSVRTNSYLAAVQVAKSWHLFLLPWLLHKRTCLYSPYPQQ